MITDAEEKGLITPGKVRIFFNDFGVLYQWNSLVL